MTLNSTVYGSNFSSLYNTGNKPKIDKRAHTDTGWDILTKTNSGTLFSQKCK